MYVHRTWRLHRHPHRLHHPSRRQVQRWHQPAYFRLPSRLALVKVEACDAQAGTRHGNIRDEDSQAPYRRERGCCSARPASRKLRTKKSAQACTRSISSLPLAQKIAWAHGIQDGTLYYTNRKIADRRHRGRRPDRSFRTRRGHKWVGMWCQSAPLPGSPYPCLRSGQSRQAQ
eukprot:scaffold92847_cov31-Tisochrysis_lutea.AAC.5